MLQSYFSASSLDGVPFLYALRISSALFLTRPSFYYEVAHKLYNNNEQALGMQVAKKSTQITGAQIYPGAKIEPGVMFSHSIGTVIGDTALIGPGCKIYQNVTLGRRSGPNAMRADRNHRHPKVEDGATIGAGALVLGPVIIGNGAQVGAGAIITRDLPDHATARSGTSDIYPKFQQN